MGVDAAAHRTTAKKVLGEDSPLVASVKMQPGGGDNRSKKPQGNPDFGRNMGVAAAIIVGGIAASTAAGALLWRGHRLAGGLIGGLVVGPTVGGIGAMIYAMHVKAELNKKVA